MELDQDHNCLKIAEAVGYKSEAAFNHIFKRAFGIGPAKYRRQLGHAKYGTSLAQSVA